MNSKIFISLFAIMLFAGLANAQGGRLYVATDAGVFVAAVQSGEVPTLTLTAGNPIKMRIIGPSGTGKTMSAGILANRTQIPCGAGGGAAGASHQHQLVKTKNLYALNTEAAWRGSCHILSVKLGNGAEYRVKVHFQ